MIRLINLLTIHLRYPVGGMFADADTMDYLHKGMWP